MSDDVFVHASSFVDDGAVLGQGCKVWHFSHIMPEARLGEHCIVGQNTFIANKVVVGNRVKIQNNVSLYEGVRLDDDVFVGPSVVFTNVNNPRSFIERKTEYRNTHVYKGASIGANATIVCGVSLGECCFIGAGSTVTKDVPAYALMVGVPAQQQGWMSDAGIRLDLPLQGEARAVCSSTGGEYELNGVALKKIS